MRQSIHARCLLSNLLQKLQSERIASIARQQSICSQRLFINRVQRARICPVCRHDELVEGRVRSTGLNYFTPKKTKFWTLKESTIETSARMCARCGSIIWFGDTAKLAQLRTVMTAESKP